MSGEPNLAHGTWEEAEALVGSTIATLQGVDEVSAGDIRRKLEVIGWDCPLHYDESSARAHGYETIVSPVSMARVWAMPAYWAPGQERIGSEQMTTPIPGASVPGEGDTLIATGVRIEYKAPVYPGDQISGAAVLKSVTRKTTRLGRGAFIVMETTYRNQRDEIVTIETVTLLRYASHSDGEQP
jgi:acyl dehydratase